MVLALRVYTNRDAGRNAKIPFGFEMMSGARNPSGWCHSEEPEATKNLALKLRDSERDASLDAQHDTLARSHLAGGMRPRSNRRRGDDCCSRASTASCHPTAARPSLGPGEIEFVACDPNDPETASYVQELGGGIMVLDPGVSGRTFIPADQIADDEDLEFLGRSL